MLLKIIILFACFFACNSLNCDRVSGRSNTECDCEVHEDGSFKFGCPQTLSKSHYLDELDGLQEALTVKYPRHPQKYIPGCKYYGNDFEDVAMDCTVKDLAEYLNALTGYFIKDLLIGCVKEVSFMNISFPKMWVNHISFFGCGFEKINDYVFLNIRGLHSLYIEEQKLKDIGFALMPLRDLRILDAKFSKFLHIKKEMFPRNLVHLDLRENPIRKIEDDAFDELDKLEFLRLPITHSKLIPDGLFKTPIKILILSGDNYKIACTEWFLDYLLVNGVKFFFEELSAYGPLTCSSSALFPGQRVGDVLKKLSTEAIQKCYGNPPTIGKCSKNLLDNLKEQQYQQRYAFMGMPIIEDKEL